MHRFYLPPDRTQSDALSLSTRETHHALNVLRLRLGDRVTVLNGVGGRYLCEVRAMDKHAVSLAVLEKEQVLPLPYQITLLQAIPKGKAMDTIVQKATELGAHRIVPLLSERTVIQVDDDSAAHKLEKWNAICVESIKQCGSTWLPKIESPETPGEFLARAEAFDLALVASLQDDSRSPRAHFTQYGLTHHRAPKSVSIWVGPEGDFTAEEYGAIQAAGALPITLGPLVLRSDTAAIYCLSILNYELQAAR
jgi:16S rRNA (uracil1498-N3)-methyltransferase